MHSRFVPVNSFFSCGFYRFFPGNAIMFIEKHDNVH